MPIYIYSHPTTLETIEIVQSIKEEHKYIDSNGVVWNREFTVPTAATDTKWDENNPQDFVEKTRNKRGTLGQMEDKAKEISLKREAKEGKDGVKEQMYKNYSKKRNGAIHPQQRQEKFNEKKKKFLKKGFDISI